MGDNGIKVYKKGEVIFKQGDFQMWMYFISYGLVGIYANYGCEDEKLLTTLEAEECFGEMGLIDSYPRSATAVALDEEGTGLVKVDADTFDSFFKERPAKIMQVMQRLCKRVRELTDDYMDACGTISEYLEAEESNKPKSEGLLTRMKKFVGVYNKGGKR